MKRIVMFSIAMLVVSSTVLAGQNIHGQTRHLLGHENQGGGHGGSGEQVVPGQGSGANNAYQNYSNNAAMTNINGNQNIPGKSQDNNHNGIMTTVADLYMILANAHHAKAIAVAELALANSSTRMKKVKMAETKIDMELQKLHEARKMLPMVKTSAARTNLTPAQAEVVHNARMNLRPAISNLRPAISNPDMLCVCDGSMTGGGNATNTPGFTGGNGNATYAPGSMTGGTGHGSTQQQGNIGQGDAGRYNYQTMNPAQSNVTNSARSQMTPARARN